MGNFYFRCFSFLCFVVFVVGSGGVGNILHENFDASIVVVVNKGCLCYKKERRIQEDNNILKIMIICTFARFKGYYISLFNLLSFKLV